MASLNIEAVRKSRSKKKKTPKKISQRGKKRKPRRVSQPTRDLMIQDMSVPQTEYSVSMDVSLSVIFEGHTDKSVLLEKLKKDVIASIETGVSTTARSCDLAASNLRVKPLKADVAVNDTLSLDEDDVVL